MKLGDLKMGDKFKFILSENEDVAEFEGIDGVFTVSDRDSVYVETEEKAGPGQDFWFADREVEKVIVNDSSDIVTNSRGGKQSRVSGRYDLMPPKALRRVAEVLATGAEKYGEWNWLKIDEKDHVNHAINHSYLHLDGDTTEDHLANAACRALFALEIYLRGGPAD